MAVFKNPTPFIKITETPRDALQGWKNPVPFALKKEYITTLLEAGFNTLDVGSFVNPAVMPQMADTGKLLQSLPAGKSTNLMALAGNIRGGIEASTHSNLDIISYPYSTSDTFLKRNLNCSREKARSTLVELAKISADSGKKLLVYLSMAFGYPYPERYDQGEVFEETYWLSKLGIQHIGLSDITGEGNPHSIGSLCEKTVTAFPEIEISLHLHSRSYDWQPKVEAAFNAGIRCFESAIGGVGGCPMTGYDLLENLNTLSLIEWCDRNGINHSVNSEVLDNLRILFQKIFVKQ